VAIAQRVADMMLPMSRDDKPDFAT
jgi:hypothetical protein